MVENLQNPHLEYLDQNLKKHVRTYNRLLTFVKKTQKLKLRNRVGEFLKEFLHHKVAELWMRVSHWLLFQKNPVGPCLYVLFNIIGFNVADRQGTSLYCPTYYIPAWHIPMCWGCVAIGYIVWTFAYFSQPDIIRDQRTAEELCRKLPFDGVMYRPGQMCETCKIPKPPRSKHCSVCGYCVANFDHHCVWINECVSRNNYGRFMTLCYTHSLGAWYGVYMLVAVQLG
jgi:hypothetical protein